ncbi:MAG: hypothetical protein ACYDIC_00565 [Desulfobaccales bacterium]
MKGLFNKIKNLSTRQRFVVSTIRMDDNVFETAVFEANFFYLPRSWSRPTLKVVTATQGEAWDLHHLLTVRLTKEYPVHIFQEYS